MRPLGLVVVLLAAMGAASPGRATPPGGSSEIVVPTEMCGEYFLIQVELDLDGDGDATRLRALFDTGGNSLLIDPDALVRAGGRRVPERKQITLRGATAGELRFGRLRPYTRELDHLSRPLGVEVDIFLPFRAFREYLLTLDFPRREMRIARGRLPPPDGREVLDARGSDRRPYLRVEIGGREHRLLIDSGSSGSIALRHGENLAWRSPLRPVSIRQGMEKLVEREVGRLEGTVKIAEVAVEEPLVEIGESTELLGTAVMRHFEWTFDQKTRRVRARPATDEPLRLAPRRGTGAVGVPAPEGRKIARVLPGTPAERAGLRVGDVVTAIDGTPVYERGCSRWREERRAETRLTILRGDETFELTVGIADLVP